MLKSYKRHYDINRSISDLWEEIRTFSETSSIHKPEKDTWSFNFSYSNRRYLSIASSIITGKVSSKDDKLSLMHIKSNPINGLRLNLLGSAVMTVLIFTVCYSSIHYVLKLLLLAAAIFGYMMLYKKETEAGIIELEQKLKINKYND